MNFYLFIKQAFLSIFANKLRSFLSTLGIIIGISSFVIMLSLWEGAKASIMKEFEWSSNVMTITSKSNPTSSAKPVLTEDISDSIPDKIPNVTHSFIKKQSYNGAFYKDKSVGYTLAWIQPGFLQFKDAKLLYGSYFDTEIYTNKDKVALLGYKLIKDTFWEENPLGKQITISWEKFLVWGILAEKNWDFDYTVFIPHTTMKHVLNVDTIESIEVVVSDEKIIDDIKKNLEFYLWKKSATDKFTDVLFQIRTNKDQLKQINNIVGKMTLLLAWIWAIALVVWGIGIMNIMLVSVTERTREIWIRKAIWARNSDIMLQFLIESIILTLIGSIIAIWFSYWVVKIIDTFIPDFSPVINGNVIMIATTVAVCMGILFGLMPAYKAAKLKVIDALSFE